MVALLFRTMYSPSRVRDPILRFVLVFMSIVPAAAGAVGAYYAPQVFKGALELGDNLVQRGLDKLCDINSGLCTVGALTRKEKREVAAAQTAMSQVVPYRMNQVAVSRRSNNRVALGGSNRNSGAIVSMANGLVQAHVAGTRKLSSGPARFRSSKGKTIVSHTEFVSTAGLTTSFLISQSAQVNPANNSMFPWLGSIATSFDKYRFISLSFEYVPVVSTNTAGRIGMIFDYDSQDSAPTNRGDCYSFATSVEGPVWDRLVMKIKTDNVVRYTDSASTVDKKLVDLGQLFAFSDAGSGTQTIGDILVHYTVELIEPQPNPLFLTERFNSTSGNGVVGLITPVLPFGANLVQISGNFNSVTLSFLSTGEYTCIISSDGGTVGGTISFTAGGGAVLGTRTEAVSTTTAVGWANVRITAPGQLLNFSGWTATTPGTQFLIVTRIGRDDFF